MAYISKQTFFSCTLTGCAGIGKTTLAKLIPTLLPNTSVLFISTLLDSGVDSIRSKVFSYVSSVGFGGLKFVIIDEADRLSEAAQDALRPLIEDCRDDTRFILTCNYLGKIIGPILSRCKPVNIEHSKNKSKIFKRLAEILKEEKVTIDRDGLLQVKNDIIEKYFPDIRLMVSSLEMSSITGTFKYQDVMDTTVTKEIAQVILEESKESNLFTLRTYWTEREGSFSRDYVALAREMFNMSKDVGQMKIIADGMYKMSIVLDKEIQFSSMVLQLINQRNGK
jgi:replication factor C small subunit